MVWQNDSCHIRVAQVSHKATTIQPGSFTARLRYKQIIQDAVILLELVSLSTFSNEFL